MIDVEPWFQKSADASPDFITYFRQWEAGTLSNEQFKMLVNKALGAQSSKPRGRAKSVKKWLEELLEVRRMVGETREQINQQSLAGDLPDARMMGDLEDLISGTMACIDAAKQSGGPPAFIDTARLQRLVVKVLGKFFPGHPLPNVEAPV